MVEDGKPIVLLVGSDLFHFEIAERDLQNRYADRCEIVYVEETEQGLETLDQLAERERQAAFIFAAQGSETDRVIEFLSRSVEIFPDARRVLMVEPGNMELVVRAIHANPAG